MRQHYVFAPHKARSTRFIGLCGWVPCMQGYHSIHGDEMVAVTLFHAFSGCTNFALKEELLLLGT